MDKIINKTINTVIYSLGILAVLAFNIAIMPMQVSAAPNTEIVNYGYRADNAVANTKTQNVYHAPKTPLVDYTGRNQDTAEDTGNQTENTDTSKQSDDGSDLAANAIFGSNGIMPSGIIQWILFGILILVIVILFRKLFGAEKRYHETPMKHA